MVGARRAPWLLVAPIKKYRKIPNNFQKIPGWKYKDNTVPKNTGIPGFCKNTVPYRTGMKFLIQLGSAPDMLSLKWALLFLKQFWVQLIKETRMDFCRIKWIDRCGSFSSIQNYLLRCFTVQGLQLRRGLEPWWWIWLWRLLPRRSIIVIMVHNNDANERWLIWRLLEEKADVVRYALILGSPLLQLLHPDHSFECWPLQWGWGKICIRICTIK